MIPCAENGGRSTVGSDSNRYKFTGKERDNESGLDDFGARYYTSSIGRFMTPDWAAMPSAVPYAVFSDPQSLNLYTYVRNDPLSHADADGHCSSTLYPQCGSGQNPTGMIGVFLNGQPVLGNWDPAKFLEDWSFNGNDTLGTIEWSKLSPEQQVLVPNGAAGWNALSATQQANFAAVTQALQKTILADKTTALSLVTKVTAINLFNIDVTWKEGAQELLQKSGFEYRLGWGHEGESGLTLHGSSQGLHLLFNDKNAGIGDIHIDYRNFYKWWEGHMDDKHNSDVRAIGPQTSGGEPINNYQRYKQWFGPIPGYNP
jgi:RHS repeat-associated protein